MKFYAFLLAVMVSYVTGNPYGAPLSVCETMEPGHGFQPQRSPSPYIVMPSTAFIWQNSFVSLGLASMSGDPFKGFMVMAFEINGTEPIGTFSLLTEGRLMSCFNENNAVTHENNDPKYMTTLSWRPPLNFVGEVEFRATYVKDLSTYWTNVTSERVEVIPSGIVSSSTVPQQNLWLWFLMVGIVSVFIVM